VATSLLLACSSSGPTEVSYETGPQGIQAGYVSVTAKTGGLFVTNQTERPVFYFVAEKNAAAVIDWVPCTTSLALCVAIAPGENIVIPWTNVAGFRPDAQEFLFTWYHIVTVNGTPQVSSLQTVTVKR
jgi:hypothetical protein